MNTEIDKIDFGVEEEEEEEEEDLFLIWIDRNITVQFNDGSIVQGIFRKFSKETMLITTPEIETVIFLSEVKFISSKNIDNTTGLGGELC